MRNTQIFLEKHNLRASDFNMEDLVSVFTSEMIKGLEGKESSLRMIPTYIEAENDFFTDVPVLAIDAGGTNFRAALISFGANGKIETGKISNYRMPGLDKEVSADEFFRSIADYIMPMAEKTQRIGFCFSYPTEILPDRDGILIQFCKEVKAPGVVGRRIGNNLLRTLGTPDKQIVLLNDTVATLLAGKSASVNKKYDSYIGYILGTGTNTCYIEYNRNILKNSSLDQARSQIINIESGNFGKAPRTDLDVLFDSTTIDPGKYTFEKMFSGGYFGGLCLCVLKTAASEGVFTAESAALIRHVTDLSSNDANGFFDDKKNDDNTLKKCFPGKQDAEKCEFIINTIIDRAAKLVAANLAAVILKTGKGKSQERPILITVEGTVFYKLHEFRPRFESYLSNYLNGDKKRFYEFIEVPQSSLIGASLAALIN
jgi:hexokinase